MIKGIANSSKYLQVTGGSPMKTFISNVVQSAGMMRYNASNYNIEVYDGSMWKELVSSYADISLTREAEVLLDWAKDKMAEEMEYKQLSEEHPAVKIALENLERAKQQLDVTIILSKEHDQTTS
jgi:hypothetical protein